MSIFECPNPNCNLPNLGKAGCCAACYELYPKILKRNELLRKALPIIQHYESFALNMGHADFVFLDNEILIELQDWDDGVRLVNAR